MNSIHGEQHDPGGLRITVKIPDEDQDHLAEALPTVTWSFGHIETKMWVKLLDPDPDPTELLLESALACAQDGYIKEGSHRNLLLVEEEGCFKAYSVRVGRTLGGSNYHLEATSLISTVFKPAKA